jgi:hypothetical protein
VRREDSKRDVVRREDSKIRFWKQSPPAVGFREEKRGIFVREEIRFQI